MACLSSLLLAQVVPCCLGGLWLVPALRGLLPSVRVVYSAITVAPSPRPTWIPTTRTFYSGDSVSLWVSYSKWPSLTLLGQSVPFSCARAPRLGCSGPSLPPNGYLPSRQSPSWFPLTRLLGSSKRTQWLTSNHAHTDSGHLPDRSHPSVTINPSVSFSRSG